MAKSVKQQMEEEQVDRELRRAGANLWAISQRFDDYDDQGVRVKSVTVKYTPDGDADFMCIIKGEDQDGHLKVAFSSGRTAAGAIQSAEQRAQERGIKWRDDKKWEPPS